MKVAIGSVVGGLILFFWQFLSWQLLNIHGPQMQYSPIQDQVLECLKSNNLPEGEYILPNKPPNMDMAEYQKEFNANYLGKPWAKVQYHHSFDNTMPLNLIRGFVIDIFAAFLLCMLLVGDPTLTFRKVLSTCISIGLIAYFTIPYLNSIWFKTNSIPDLIDAFVPWTIIGLVLGWLLPRKIVRQEAVK